MFLLNIMLIYDDPLLHSQPPLSGNSLYPEGGFLMAVQLYFINRETIFLSYKPASSNAKQWRFLLHLRFFIYSFYETSVSSKNNSKKRFLPFRVPGLIPQIYPHEISVKRKREMSYYQKHMLLVITKSWCLSHLALHIIAKLVNKNSTHHLIDKLL